MLSLVAFAALAVASRVGAVAPSQRKEVSYSRHARKDRWFSPLQLSTRLIHHKSNASSGDGQEKRLSSKFFRPVFSPLQISSRVVRHNASAAEPRDNKPGLKAGAKPAPSPAATVPASLAESAEEPEDAPPASLPVHHFVAKAPPSVYGRVLHWLVQAAGSGIVGERLALARLFCLFLAAVAFVAYMGGTYGLARITCGCGTKKRRRPMLWAPTASTAAPSAPKFGGKY